MKNPLIPSIVTFLLCVCNLLQGVPAIPYPVEYTLPDNTTVIIQLHGDERVHWATTADGYTILQNKEGYFEYATKDLKGDLVPSGIKVSSDKILSKQTLDFLKNTPKNLFYSESQIEKKKALRQPDKSLPDKAFPTTGNRKLLCILVRFTDVISTFTQSDFNNLFNQAGYSYDGATGSVNDYYSEVSYDQFNLTVDVAGPYTLAHNMAYYGGNDVNGDDLDPRAMVTEAVNLAVNDVNYADYDNDNNGVVDGVYIIFAGYGEEAGADDDAIWSHAWGITPVYLDGKYISSYSCSPELRSNTGSGITRIGVICHEFGHVLGAPDYYDTDGNDSGGDFNGTGYWDIMAMGSWNNLGITPAHHNAFTKTYIYGWADVTELSTPATLTLYHAKDSTNSFYRFNTTTTDEYFIMENRSKEGFDSYIPGEGLIIYHVHADIYDAFGWDTINIKHPQMFYPVCASADTLPGLSPSDYGNINSAGCPFPGSFSKTSFTDATIPSARSWAGANTNQPITNITFNGISNIITLDYMGGSNPTGGEDCTDAISLGGSSGSIDYSTTGFNNDYYTDCGGTNEEDRVYHLIKPVENGESVSLWTTDDDYDVVLYATYGTCTGTLIDCVDEPEGSTLSWTNNTGTSQEIWVFADGNGETSGNATLHWSIETIIAGGDNCDNAVELSGTNGSQEYTTTGYLDDYILPCEAGGEDVVFHITTPVEHASTIYIWTTGDDYDVLLAATYGSCLGDLAGCVDDPDGTAIKWTNNTEQDQYIWIFADGYDGDDGSAEIHWQIENPDNIEEEKPQDLLIYPNPATDKVTVSAGDGIAINKISIYNTYGLLVYESAISTYSSEIDISGLPAGTYIADISGVDFSKRATLVIVR